MTRAAFIDILRDYLKKYFSPNESEDIVRDYEEYFDAGIEAGKTESEIISALGSPKNLAEQLAEELRSKKYEQNSNGSAFSAFIQGCERFGNQAFDAGKKQARVLREKTRNYMEQSGNEQLSATQRSLSKLMLIFIYIAQN
ncbi:MAG: DUF1700 domain-containing protein, partial [Bacilli bacterium]